MVHRSGRRFSHRAGKAHPLHPGRAPLMDELADQHGPGIGIGVVSRPDPAPVYVELDECGLHEVIRALPVIAQHRGQASQRRQPGRDVLRVLGVPAAAHQGPPYALTYSTIARGTQRRIRLPRPPGFIRVRRQGWTVGRTITSPTSTESGWAMAKAIVSATASGDMAISSRQAMSDASSSGSRV